MNNFDSNAVFVNCRFLGNSTTNSGGGIRTSGGSVVVTNCTFAGNSTFGSNGGGIASLTNGTIVTNSILWGNTGGAFGGSGVPVVSFSNVEGGFNGTGNINADPLFANQANGDVRLSPGSPCIDVGSNDALPSDLADLDDNGDTDEALPLDLDGNARVINDIVDMGAHESSQ